jgi:hypothetical protein
MSPVAAISTVRRSASNLSGVGGKLMLRVRRKSAELDPQPTVNPPSGILLQATGQDFSEIRASRPPRESKPGSTRKPISKDLE